MFIDLSFLSGQLAAGLLQTGHLGRQPVRGGLQFSHRLLQRTSIREHPCSALGRGLLGRKFFLLRFGSQGCPGLVRLFGHLSHLLGKHQRIAYQHGNKQDIDDHFHRPPILPSGRLRNSTGCRLPAMAMADLITCRWLSASCSQVLVASL